MKPGDRGPHDRINAFIRRHMKDLSLPCEDTEREGASYEAEEGPHQDVALIVDF